ncbi:MAG TPA: PspC domain-containing protein [Protaetiibacter sp.]|nr:PspC domain-containing protein [Protaetiibacter sp.]
MARRTTASAPPPDEAADEASETTASEATAADEPAAASPGPASAPGESGFFTWLRALGVQRQNGWLGGVCGGIAARIGLDPLLVRGIAVVLAVVGAPVVLLYAIAWFLLPDAAGTIHARELGHGRVTRALPGIVAVFLLSFLPLTQGFWYAGALYWGDLGWGGATGRIIWTAVLLAAVIVLVVWLARRSSAEIPMTPATEIPMTPATTDDRPETVPTFPADGADADAASTPAAASLAAAASAPATELGEPPAPPADASAEELANWKASQDEWQKQRAAWAAEQRRSERERRQADAHAQATEAARLARERARIRKLTRPRASAGIVFLVLGVALVSGAIAAFSAAQSPGARGAEWMIGAAVLVLALGLGTVAVALGRRRSGALAFFSILAVLALVAAVVVPTDRTTILPGAAWGIDTSRDGRYAQLAGSTTLYVSDRDGDPVVVDLWQLAGTVQVDLEEGATVRVELTTDGRDSRVTVDEHVDGSTGGNVSQRYADYRVRDGRLRMTAGEGEADVVLRVWAGSATRFSIVQWTSDETPLSLTPAPDHSWAIDGWGRTIETTPSPTPPADPADTAEGEAP